MINELVENISTKWWIACKESGVEFDPKSDRCVNILERVLRTDMEFEQVVIDYIIEKIKPNPTHFATKGDLDSGIDVDDDETAVSAHLDDEDEEDKDKNEAVNEAETWVKNIKSGNVYTVQDFNDQIHTKPSDSEIAAAKAEKGDGANDGESDGVPRPQKSPEQIAKEKAREKGQADIAQNSKTDFEKEQEEKEKNPKPKKRMVAGKDKTLEQTDTLKSDEFTRDLEPDDESYDDGNEDYALPTPPRPYRMPEDLGDVKFPKKYLKVLERMMNTLPKGNATKWQHYSDIPGGQGQVSAQAGELMTMAGISMDDNQFDTFINSLKDHNEQIIKDNPELKSESKRIITKSWIKAAENNRNAILSRIDKQYPGAEVVATAWDNKDDVEALGVSDYEKNKGFSTDVFVKLKDKDGNEILDEVSLKKSDKVNFLNSGAGKFTDWDDNLPDNVNQNVYRDNQRKDLTKIGRELMGDVNNLLNSAEGDDLRRLFNTKKVDFETAVNDTSNGKGSRGKSKVILQAINKLAETGNDKAAEYIKQSSEKHKEFQKNAVEAITKNDKLKNGMLNDIRSEFPLKAISDGEETMAIGPHSLDKSTMKEIFGTNDFDEIKENIKADPGPPPFLGYKADVNDKIIPIAEIKIREDGVGYGGQMKFEMVLDPRFAKLLKDAHNTVYGS